jgi:hypothetical protein
VKDGPERKLPRRRWRTDYGHEDEMNPRKFTGEIGVILVDSHRLLLSEDSGAHCIQVNRMIQKTTSKQPSEGL